MKRWKSAASILLLVTALTASTALVAGASVPSAATGPRGTGIGTKAALSEPTCDPDTGLVKFANPFGNPQCVVPLADGASNGGATSQGVTKTSVKVVTLLPPPGTAPTAATKVTDQATGQATDPEQGIKDTADVFFKTVYETWGRTPDFEFVTATGTDEASQRADAITVAAMKPFAVFDYLGQSVFAKAVAAKKIITFSLTASVTDTLALAPYLWRPASGFDTLVSNTGELVCKALKGKKAHWAGDTSLQSKARKFGYVYDAASTSVNTTLFTDVIKKCGVTATAYSFQGTTDSAQAQSVADAAMATLVPKLKSDGITSVILFNSSASANVSITKEATKQEYSPEWIVTGVGYSDIDITARNNDPAQMRHAFGIAGLIPAVLADSSTPWTNTYQWYWARTRVRSASGRGASSTSSQPASTTRVPNSRRRPSETGCSRCRHLAVRRAIRSPPCRSRWGRIAGFPTTSTCGAATSR